MTTDELNDLPNRSELMNKDDLLAWIATRKGAGASVNVETAELKGWWCAEGDPYDLVSSAEPQELGLQFFVRDAESRGWVWQYDLGEDKCAIVQARIDEHSRKVKDFYAERRAAGALINVDTCEESWWYADDTDPYGVELAPSGSMSKNSFVRNNDREDWVCLVDLPDEKCIALNERAERERSTRQDIIDSLFYALRQGGCLAAAVIAVAAAEKSYGRRSVRDALESDYVCGAIGGHLIQRGYLTIEHVAELLRGEPKGPPTIFPP
jgi:hypothetical protein